MGRAHLAHAPPRWPPTPSAQTAFDALPFTHRKEFARRVAEAERQDTRVKRVGQTLVMLREGRTRS